MCGIAAILATRPGERIGEREILALRDAQSHRGPDGAGLWLAPDGSAALGHRRLAIIDLSEAGAQPMASADGRHRIVFNGEIYNHRELRRELEALGRIFRSASDTEVLLHGYAQWGRGLLDRLRGMFAFVLHDAHERSAFLARDPLGIKPLYYAETSGRLVCASEVQAIRPQLASDALDPQALADCLAWGSIPAPRTLHAAIRALAPGHCASFDAHGALRVERWFRLEDCFSAAPAVTSEAQAREVLHDALRDSVRAHMIADVPVGAFLSGGVDSGALVALMREQDLPVRSVNLAFDAPGLDESELARATAERYGSDHRVVPIDGASMRERMPEAVRALDQPSVDGVNTYFVAEAAVRAGLKVAVSGVGGDELFGGYASFARVPRLCALHAAFARPLGPLRPALARAAERFGFDRRADKLALALRYGGDECGAYFAERGLFTPAEIRALLAPDFAREIPDPAEGLRGRVDAASLPQAERVSALEFAQYLQCQLLRDTDAVAMRHSLEVRTPLVDRTLLEAACRVAPALRRAGPAKRMLREAPLEALPDALWRLPKRGFTMPFERWLRSGELALRLPAHAAFRPQALQRVEQRFRAGRLHFSRPWLLHVLAAHLG